MRLNRRDFLAGTGAFAAPLLLNGCCSCFKSNEKINVGVVGIGRISTTMDIPYTIRYTDRCRFTAVCDLDSRRLMHGVKFIKAQYRKLTGEANAPVKAYSDYRDMMADPSIDAVMICIPDHWHALVAVEAMLQGKHIWLQKPFAQTVQEGRIIAEVARMTGRVVQVGSWQRSVYQFALVCELVRSGRIGAVKRVEVGVGLDRAGGSSAVEPVPENLNYEMWLGPTPGPEASPYNWTRVHTQDLAKIGNRPGWIQMAPYGWGMITNWGAHHLDIAQWGLGKDDSGPEGVSGTCEWMDTSGGKLWNVHTTYDLHYSYNGGKTDLHLCNKYPCGVKFIGENGDWLYCQRGAAKVTPSDPDTASGGKTLPLMASKNKLLEPIAGSITKPGADANGHFLGWLEGVRKGDPASTVTNAEIAQRSSSVCCLGQMCMELSRGKKDGASLKWCPKKETTCCEAAKKMLKPFARGEYDLAKTLARFGKDISAILKA